MSSQFESKLSRIIEMSPPNMRSKIKKDLITLSSYGVNSFESLLSILGDKNVKENVRMLACWLLGQIGDKRAVGAILKAFKQQNIYISLEAAKSLGILESKRATKSLIEAMLTAGNIEKRVASAYALGLLCDKRGIKPLVSILGDKDAPPQVRAQSAEALTYFNNKSRDVIKVIMLGLQDPSAEVRFWSIFALGELKVKKAIRELERVAATDNTILPGWWSVGEEASNALKKIL